MLFHFKVIAALCDSQIKWVINHPNCIFIFFFKPAHFVTRLKRKLFFRFQARPLRKVFQNSIWICNPKRRRRVTSAASVLLQAPVWPTVLRIYVRGGVMCILDAGARGESEGCFDSIDCGTCFQKQRGNHPHVQLCTVVKLAMFCVLRLLGQISRTFFFQCTSILTYQCWTVRRRRPHVGCGSLAPWTNTTL